MKATGIRSMTQLKLSIRADTNYMFLSSFGGPLSLRHRTSSGWRRKRPPDVKGCCKVPWISSPSHRRGCSSNLRVGRRAKTRHRKKKKHVKTLRRFWAGIVNAVVNSGFRKTRATSWIAKRLLAPHEELCYIELVGPYGPFMYFYNHWG